MTIIVEPTRAVTGGVDTHLDVHVAAVLDEIGGLLATESFVADQGGEHQLVDWLESFGSLTGGGEIEVRLIAKGGRIGLGEITETGEPVFVPLERVRTHRNADKGGTFRWYNDYRLPERLGGGIVTVRLHSNDDDKQRKFNRAENVRQIPPGDPDFETLYKRRLMRRASTDISTTRSGSDEPIRSVRDVSC